MNKFYNTYRSGIILSGMIMVSFLISLKCSGQDWSKKYKYEKFQFGISTTSMMSRHPVVQLNLGYYLSNRWMANLEYGLVQPFYFNRSTPQNGYKIQPTFRRYLQDFNFKYYSYLLLGYYYRKVRLKQDISTINFTNSTTSTIEGVKRIYTFQGPIIGYGNTVFINTELSIDFEFGLGPGILKNKYSSIPEGSVFQFIVSDDYSAYDGVEKESYAIFFFDVSFNYRF